MINRAREASFRQLESEQSEDIKSNEEVRLGQEREESQGRLQKTQEEKGAKKRQEETTHPTQELSNNRHTVIRKDPQRPYHRALPDIGDLVGVGAALPDCRVFNAFEYISGNHTYHGYPHIWKATMTKESGLIYLPEHWAFIHNHPRPWGSFIGPKGQYTHKLNENFREVVQICGQQVDAGSRLHMPREDHCEIHGLVSTQFLLKPIAKTSFHSLRVDK